MTTISKKPMHLNGQNVWVEIANWELKGKNKCSPEKPYRNHFPDICWDIAVNDFTDEHISYKYGIEFSASRTARRIIEIYEGSNEC